jgi:hypothetical protein
MSTRNIELPAEEGVAGMFTPGFRAADIAFLYTRRAVLWSSLKFRILHKNNR